MNEVLRQIFSSNDLKTNAICAQVCRQWSEQALDVLWEELDPGIGRGGLVNLISVLVELKNVHGERYPRCTCGCWHRSELFGRSKWVLASKIRFGNWERFRFYANRVKGLRISASDGICKSVFIDLGCCRPMHELLPNLNKLNLDLELCSQLEMDPAVGKSLPRYSLLFLHGGVKELSLSLPSESVNWFQDTTHPDSIGLPELIEEIVGRAASVTSLRLFFKCAVNPILKQVQTLASGLEHLRDLAIPAHAFTPQMVASLTRLLDIRKITVSKYVAPEDSFVYLNGTYPLSWRVCFRNLRVLEFYGHANVVRHWLQINTFPVLTELSVHKLSGFTAASTRDVLLSVVGACHSLEKLRLLEVRNGDSVPQTLDNRLSNADVVDKSSLQPLKRLHSLVSLTIECTIPAQLNDDELTDWVSQCPSLTTLHLTREPCTRETPNLTLDILYSLEERGSRIVDLGLYVDTTAQSRFGVSTRHGLKHMQRLNLGPSPITSIRSVSTYLAQFLPFELDTTLQQCPYSGHGATERMQKWEQVKTCLECLTNVQTEDWVRIKALERSVKMLKGEIRELRESVDMQGQEPIGME